MQLFRNFGVARSSKSPLFLPTVAPYLPQMPARRQPSPKYEAASRSGLRLHAEGERLAALLRERDRLLSTIQTKKRTLEQALADTESARGAALEKLAPLVNRYESLVAEIRELFDELLAPGRLSASAAKKVAKVRRSLEAQGLFSDFEQASFDSEHDFWQEPPERGRPRGRPNAGSAHAPGDEYRKREVDSAEQHGQAKNRESLRAVFRRLVVASHPDRASHDAERQERTAAMKQATQAYEQGDLARLLELEKAWQSRQSLPPRESDEARCRQLELVTRELRAQARQLQAELRALKDSSSSNPLGTPLEQAVEEAQAELEQLEAMRNFVLGFRDGKISLTTFVEGPKSFPVDEELEAFISEVFADFETTSVEPQPAPRSKRRRKR